MVSKIEVREEHHPDVVKHVHPRHVEVIRVPLPTGEIAHARQFLISVLRHVITRLVSVKVLGGSRLKFTMYCLSDARWSFILVWTLSKTLHKVKLQWTSMTLA